MLNEESRRKIRELKIDELIEILDDQEQRPIEIPHQAAVKMVFTQALKECENF